jgi:hypothetical protein
LAIEKIVDANPLTGRISLPVNAEVKEANP